MSNGRGVSGVGGKTVASAGLAVVAAIIAHQLISRRSAMNEEAAVEIYRSVFKKLNEPAR